MNNRDLLSTPEAGEYIHRPARTLTQWRYLSQGPPFLKVGGSVLYDRADLDTWLDAQRVDPAAACEAR